MDAMRRHRSTLAWVGCLMLTAGFAEASPIHHQPVTGHQKPAQSHSQPIQKPQPLSPWMPFGKESSCVDTHTQKVCTGLGPFKSCQLIPCFSQELGEPTYCTTLSNTAVCQVKDTDGDGLQDYKDNCVTVANPDQTNSVNAPFGDACYPLKLEPNFAAFYAGKAGVKEWDDCSGFPVASGDYSRLVYGVTCRTHMGEFAKSGASMQKQKTTFHAVTTYDVATKILGTIIENYEVWTLTVPEDSFDPESPYDSAESITNKFGEAYVQGSSIISGDGQLIAVSKNKDKNCCLVNIYKWEDGALLDQIDLDVSHLNGGFRWSKNGRYIAYNRDLDGSLTCVATVYDRLLKKYEDVGVSSENVPIEPRSYVSTLSDDGRYIAFESFGTNVQEPPVSWEKIFLRDREAGTTVPVNVNPQGEFGNGAANGASMSSDGHFMTFRSGATNLSNNNSPIGRLNIFLYDRVTGDLTQVSQDVLKKHEHYFGGWMSASGRFVGYFRINTEDIGALPGNIKNGAFIYDRVNGVTKSVCLDKIGCDVTGMSKDGRFIAFRKSGALYLSINPLWDGQ
jgi:hypothetical protein